MNLFEIATRKGYRFNFRGLITVEDLWNLTVEQLDEIFKALNEQMKKSSEESLLNKKTDKDVEVEHKIEIVKHIVTVKLEEHENAILEQTNKHKKDKLLAILASKQDEDLKNKSVDEIKQMIESL